MDQSLAFERDIDLIIQFLKDLRLLGSFSTPLLRQNLQVVHQKLSKFAV